jgi:transposase
MPRAYSLDLRQRVIAACEAGVHTRREIARQFQISEATLYTWLQRWHNSGSYRPQPHGGGPVRRLDAAVLRELVGEQNDRTLAEYAEAYEQRTGRRYTRAHLCTALQELGLSRKGRRSARRSI